MDTPFTFTFAPHPIGMRAVFSLAWLEFRALLGHRFAPLVGGLALLFVGLATSELGPTSAPSPLAEWTRWAQLCTPWTVLAVVPLSVFAGSAMIAARRRDGRWDTLKSLPIPQPVFVLGLLLGRFLFSVGAAVGLYLGLAAWVTDCASPALMNTALAVAVVAASLTGAVFAVSLAMPRGRIATGFGLLLTAAWCVLTWHLPGSWAAELEAAVVALMQWLNPANPIWLWRASSTGLIPIASLLGVVVSIMGWALIAVIIERSVQFSYERTPSRLHLTVKWPGRLALVGGAAVVWGVLPVGLALGFGHMAWDFTHAQITKPGPRADKLRPFLARVDPAAQPAGPLLAAYFEHLTRRMPASKPSRWEPARRGQEWEGVIYFDDTGNLPAGLDMGGGVGRPLLASDVQAWQTARFGSSGPAKMLELPDAGSENVLVYAESLALSLVDQRPRADGVKPRERITIMGDDFPAAWSALLKTEGYTVATALPVIAPGVAELERRSRDVLVLIPRTLSGLSASNRVAIEMFRAQGGAVLVCLPHGVVTPLTPQAQSSPSRMAKGLVPREASDLADLLTAWGLWITPAEWSVAPEFAAKFQREVRGQRLWLPNALAELMHEPGTTGDVVVAVSLRSYAVERIAPSDAKPNAWTAWMQFSGDAVKWRVPVSMGEGSVTVAPPVVLDLPSVPIWGAPPGKDRSGPACVSSVETFTNWPGHGTRIVNSDTRDVVCNIVAKLAERPADAQRQRRKPLVEPVVVQDVDGRWVAPWLGMLAAIVAAIWSLRRHPLTWLRLLGPRGMTGNV